VCSIASSSHQRPKPKIHASFCSGLLLRRMIDTRAYEERGTRGCRPDGVPFAACRSTRDPMILMRRLRSVSDRARMLEHAAHGIRRSGERADLRGAYGRLLLLGDTAWSLRRDTGFRFAEPNLWLADRSPVDLLVTNRPMCSMRHAPIASWPPAEASSDAAPNTTARAQANVETAAGRRVDRRRRTCTAAPITNSANSTPMTF
jgi:hypothetical protein